MTTFSDLELRPELLEALTALGYEEPTPIQSEAIPPLLAGRDLLGQAATGTGKTAAFALPILQRAAARPLAAPRPRSCSCPRASSPCRSPRRCTATAAALARACCRSTAARRSPASSGCSSAASTSSSPRRAARSTTSPAARSTSSELKVVVLDEADEMFDMGFAEDLEAIFEATPDEHQTVLFSATMPPKIEQMARRRLRDPERISIARETATEDGAPLVRQSAYIVARSHKPAALGRVLDVESPAAALVFCRTRAEVDSLAETLNGRGYRAEALHGGMTQDQRDRVMSRLRNETADLIVATDVAARGLDIDQLTHVVNYDVPSDPDSYTHRIGRVGRAGREGVAITLAEPREHRMLKTIERATGQRITIEKLPTVADLRARRLELTRSALEQTLAGGGLDEFRVVLDTLAGEYDVVEIALAAVKLAHEASVSSTRTSRRSPRSPSARPKARQRQGRAAQHDAPVHRRRPRRAASARATWWARSRASRASTAARSARSRSPTASRSSRSPTTAPKR